MWVKTQRDTSTYSSFFMGMINFQDFFETLFEKKYLTEEGDQDLQVSLHCCTSCENRVLSFSESTWLQMLGYKFNDQYYQDL